MMRIGEAMRQGRQLLNARSFVAASVILAFAFWGLFSGLWELAMLLHEMSRPLALQCSIPEDLKEREEELRKLPGVKALTAYQELEGVWQWSDYQTEVLLVGLEATPFLERYRSVMAAEPSRAMPYAIVEQAAVESLKNSRGDCFEGELQELLLETTFFGDDPVRICGIADDDSERKPRMYVQMEAFADLAEAEDSGSEEKAEPTVKSYHELQAIHGFALPELEASLEAAQVTILRAEGEQKATTRWKEKAGVLKVRLLLALSGMYCGILVTYYQGRIWRLENPDAIRQLQKSGERGGLAPWSARRLWYTLAGLGGGLVLWWLLSGG